MDINSNNINDIINNLKNLASLICDIGDKINSAPGLKKIPVKIPQGSIRAILPEKSLLYSVINEVLFEGYAGGDQLFTQILMTGQEHKIRETIQLIENFKMMTNTDITTELRNKINMIKDEHTIMIQQKIAELDDLKEQIKNKERQLKEMSKLKKLLDSHQQNDEENRCEIINILKSSIEYEDYIGLKYNMLDWETIKQRCKIMIMDLSMFIKDKSQINLSDYEKQIGGDFEPICALMYKMSKEGHKLDGLKRALALVLKNKLRNPMDEMIQKQVEIENDMESLVRNLKEGLKNKGIYCRKVGETTEYYGLSNDVFEERDQYKEKCGELQAKIGNLVKEFENIRKPLSEERSKKIEELLNSGKGLLTLDIMNYLKHKLYRQKTLQKSFENVDFKPGMRYAGIAISKWHYDYLSGKSLTPVLSKKPEEIHDINSMKYSIKLLIKLNKIMDAKKALLWVRNLYAKKLGRNEAGPKVEIMEQQEQRFYNTYIFEDDINYDDFCSVNDKPTRFFKQYKQLDREINAHYLTRFYKKETKKAMRDHQIGNTKLAISAHVYKHECGHLIDCVKNKNYKPKRNPLVAYRKIVDLVNKRFEATHTQYQRLDIIESMETSIPQITFGGNEPNQKFIKFCKRAVQQYKKQQYFGFDDEIICFKEAIERSKEYEKMEEEYESSSDESSGPQYYSNDSDF